MGRKLAAEAMSARTTVEVLAVALVAFLFVVQSRENSRREQALQREMGRAREQVLMLRQEVANLSMQNNRLTTRLEQTAKAALEAQTKSESAAEGADTSPADAKEPKPPAPTASKRAQNKSAKQGDDDAPAAAERPRKGPSDRS